MKIVFDPTEKYFKFLQEYYSVLERQPEQLHGFYGDTSKLGRPSFDEEDKMNMVSTLPAIQEKIQSFGSSYTATIFSMDAQVSGKEYGLIVLVIGQLIRKVDNARRSFAQTFFLALNQDKVYFILNDVFRFVDDAPTITVASPPFFVVGDHASVAAKEFPSSSSLSDSDVDDDGFNHPLPSAINEEDSTDQVIGSAAAKELPASSSSSDGNFNPPRLSSFKEEELTDPVVITSPDDDDFNPVRSGTNKESTDQVINSGSMQNTISTSVSSYTAEEVQVAGHQQQPDDDMPCASSSAASVPAAAAQLEPLKKHDQQEETESSASPALANVVAPTKRKGKQKKQRAASNTSRTWRWASKLLGLSLFSTAGNEGMTTTRKDKNYYVVAASSILNLIATWKLMSMIQNYD